MQMVVHEVTEVKAREAAKVGTVIVCDWPFWRCPTCGWLNQEGERVCGGVGIMEEHDGQEVDS